MADNPVWFDLTIWRKTAEAVATYCAKGHQLIVAEASLRPDHVNVAGKQYATVTMVARRTGRGVPAVAGRGAARSPYRQLAAVACDRPR